jgi:tetratricopeptide (TPR) repeat protein
MYRTFSHPNHIIHYNFIAIVITLCLLTSCAKEVGTTEKSPEVSSTAIGDALREADRLFGERADIVNLENAVKALGRVRDPDRRNFEVEWKYAKYCYFLGKGETDQTVAAETFEKGRDAGRIAARVEKEKPDGHFWFAANLGELARMSPLTVGLKSVDEIREAMQKVVDSDPSYQGASAFDALGQLEIATRNFKGGKTEKAVEYYEKGLSLAPDNSNIRVHLAEALLALKRDAEARKQIDTVISMKPNPEFVVEHKIAVRKAKDLLSKNF